MKRIFAFICVLVIAISMLVIPASAANTEDKPYYNSYIAAGTWHTTYGYYKENASKVYVKPSQSPTTYTRVQTWCYDASSGNASNKTANGTVSLPLGYACVITNYVYENGVKTTDGVFTWLKMTPSSGTGTLSGNWSPDWSGIGDVKYF